MFSEYASRFIQQSRTGLPFTPQPDSRSNSRHPLDRRRASQQQYSRYVQRPTSSLMQPQNPYLPTGSQSRFPFAGLAGRNRDAPLLAGGGEDAMREEDERRQYERDMAALDDLQRSRQHFMNSKMTDSSDLSDNEGIEPVEGQRHDRDYSPARGRPGDGGTARFRDHSMPDSEASGRSSHVGGKGKGKFQEVNLNSTINEGDEPDDGPPASLAQLGSEMDSESPPTPFHTFRPAHPSKEPRQSSFMPAETDSYTNAHHPRPPSPDRESVPPTVILPSQEPPRHDAFWATIFQISTFAMYAAFVLIWFHTAAPTSKAPLGDTVYSALRGSTTMLLWDTMIAIVVALIWLALLRHHVRNLVYLMLLAVPVVLFAFSLYPLISSFKGTYHGNSVQDKVMRWLSFVPFLFAVFWSWSIVTNRHALSRSIKILEFSTKILAASPSLIALGFATLGVVVGFTWTWMLMFERIFLSGHFSTSTPTKWVLYANSWWLGVFFILQYLWTLGVIAGVQRATTAATVSQWYFHRLAVPQPTSQQVVRASFAHAIGALFGTVCLSTFLSLLVRLPLIILPGRLSGIMNMCAYALIPTSLATLTNPLTLTYAAIHSQPLGISARGLGQLAFVSRTNPSNTLRPRNFNPRDAAGSALIPYRLAKLLLQATKWIMSAALGFGGWIRTARSLTLSTGADTGIKGSLYAYIVGLIAGTIGFAVLGAIENVVGAVLDAAVICWASETGGHGEARFCREAGELFGNEGEVRLMGAERDEEY